MDGMNGLIIGRINDWIDGSWINDWIDGLMIGIYDWMDQLL
jgi:hypothetical protein